MTETQNEPKDPQNEIKDISKDGKISAADLKAKLEASDQRSLVRNAKEGLKTYMESNEKNKQEFVTMCEDMLLKNSVKSDKAFVDKLTLTDRATAKKQETFTPQERAYIGIAGLYLTIKGVEKGDDYATVKNFLTNKAVKDRQGKDLQLNTIVAPTKPVTEVVLDSKPPVETKATSNETAKNDKEVEKNTPPIPQEVAPGNAGVTTDTTTQRRDPEIILKEPNTLDQGATIPSLSREGKGLTNKTETPQPKNEAIDTTSTNIIDKNNDLEEASKMLENGLKASPDLYKNDTFSNLMQDYTRDMNRTMEKSIKDTFAPMFEMIKKQEDMEIMSSLRQTTTVKEMTSEEKVTQAKGEQQQKDFGVLTEIFSAEKNNFDGLKNSDGSLNSAGELMRTIILSSLTSIAAENKKLAANLTAKKDEIAPDEKSPERTNLTTLIENLTAMSNKAYALATDLGSDTKDGISNPAEGKFVKLLQHIQNNPNEQFFSPFSNNSTEASSKETTPSPTQVADTFAVRANTKEMLQVNEGLYSTFGLPNTLKNGKLDDIRTSLNQFKDNTVPHEINGEIIYFNKDQLDKQGLLGDTGEIKDESDQLLLDAKTSGKVGAWSVSELVNDAHDNKNSIFFPNEDGKDIRELGDDKQQKRLEQLAEQPVTEMSEKREEKTFDEQDLAGKLDKKLDLNASRLLLTDILKQPGLKWNALGMEKPEQSFLNKNDFLKLNIGDETRYISTNDYLDLTKDSRETNKREKNNIDDNQANETENTRIDYSSLAEQKYNLSAFTDEWKVDTQGSKLTFANKETKQIIGLDMKNTDAPIFSFTLDNKPFSLTTSPEHAEKVFDRIQDLNEKYTSLQEAYKDNDTSVTDQVFQLGFLQDHASDLISGNEMDVDAKALTGIEGLPTGKQQLTIDNFIYDDEASLLSYSATGEKKKTEKQFSIAD